MGLVGPVQLAVRDEVSLASNSDSVVADALYGPGHHRDHEPRLAAGLVEAVAHRERKAIRGCVR
jgi:hypothetical protein